MNEAFNIIGHSLGIDTYNAKSSNRKKDKILPMDFYRNHYCYGYKTDGTELERRFELMKSLNLIESFENIGTLYFCITEKGKKLFREKFKKEISDKYIPLSKSKERYQRYLEYGDGFENFIQFCRWDGEKERSWN